MNGVELARQIAADLYYQAVAKGIDPWEPYSFVIAEAKRRGYEVEQTEVNAAILDGGKATIIPKFKLILHESGVSLFEQAFLVAHEIGHIELGDDFSEEPASEIDMARSSEPSPIGFNRVVDYGRRQRREIQMDLFAREFLLPRDVVRRLHLKEGLSATAIANKLGAPFDLVAQQLLDALLLPPFNPPKEDKAKEYPLNPLQNKAITHRGSAYLLEAGPGTGKTQTLAARVEWLLSEGIDPKQILVLTFSNKAANEMAERIARTNKEAATAMWIGTFHAFGLDVIRRFHVELGLPKDPRMLDRTEAVELLEHEFPRLNLNHYRDLYDPTQHIADILTAISRAKDEVVDELQYTDLAKKMLQNAESEEEYEEAERALEVAKVFETYEKLKRRDNCIDFGDLVLMPVKLMEENSEIRAHFMRQYGHVLVDEYQDVNRSSVRLLVCLQGDGRNLWVVGDSNQSIYRFRGASSFNMERFGNEDFPGGIRGRLKRNYRSVREVLDCMASFSIGMNGGSQENSLESDRGASGNLPELITVEKMPQQSQAIADSIEKMRRHGHNYRDQVVLCTGNDKLSTLGQELELIGVPVLFLGSLFERSEIRDLLSFLTILTDRRAMGLVRLGCMPEFEMPISDIDTIYQYLRSLDCDGAIWLKKRASIKGLSEGGQLALNALARATEDFDQNSSPWLVLAKFLLDRTRIAARISDSDDTRDCTCGIAIWQFMNFLQGQPIGKGPPISQLLDRVRRLVRLGDDRELRQLPLAAEEINAVRLMTIHGAKGLEFEVVHISSFNRGTIPRTPPNPRCPPPVGMVEGAKDDPNIAFRIGQAEEQECLFYVALSRARDRLFFYAATQMANGRSRGISNFHDRLDPKPIKRKHESTEISEIGKEEASLQLEIEGNQKFTGSQLNRYEKCPRRFFYSYILQIGGRRAMTGYMQMHEGVRNILHAVISNPNLLKSDQDMEKQVEEALFGIGLTNHGYLSDFKDLAIGMVRYFLKVRDGFTPKAPYDLSIVLGKEEVIVSPNDVLQQPNGELVFRRVKTGHFRKPELEDLDTVALLLATREMRPKPIVEMVHLADQKTRILDLSKQKLLNREEKLQKFLKKIRAGVFPPNPESRKCPGCPAFFVCGPLPSGIFRKKN